MKLKFFAAALCMVMGISLSAQTPKETSKDSTPKQFPSEKMIQDLKLTPKQVTEMKNFYQEQQAEREKFRQEQRSMTQEQKAKNTERKSAMEQRRAENRDKLKSILTPEQYTKYLEMQVDKKPKMDGKRQKMDGKKQNRRDKDCSKDCNKPCPTQKDTMNNQNK